MFWGVVGWVTGMGGFFKWVFFVPKPEVSDIRKTIKQSSRQQETDMMPTHHIHPL